MLFENNPLTTVCSLICNHEKQCEGHCVLGKKGTPVHFSVIENYISSTYASQMVKGPAPSNGMKVAIVGSGPAGITIAILMARYGYQVTIFESKDQIGGILRYGIPEFRLPKSTLDDIQYRHLELKGIKIRPNTRIGDAIQVDDLFRDGRRKGIFSICLCLSGCTVRDHSALTQPDVRLSELVILMPEGSNDRDRGTDVRCGKYSYFEYRVKEK